MVLAGAASGFKCETTKFDRWSLISEEPQTKRRRRRARQKRGERMDFTPRYVPHSLFSFFRMTTQSLSEVRCFTPLESVECSCLLLFLSS